MSRVDGPTVHLCFPARADFLLLGRLALTGLARAHAMSEDDLADLKLGLTEACGNVVRHAYADGGGTVDVWITIAGDLATIVVSDAGRGIAHAAEAGERAAEAGTEGSVTVGESGMGFAIMRAIADTLEIESAGADAGTLVRISKRLDTSPPTSSPATDGGASPPPA